MNSLKIPSTCELLPTAIVVLLFAIIAFAAPAAAQTTFTSADCNANITITGAGLTLTSTQAGNFVGCRASQGKQSGLLYYEFTLNHSPVATTFGVADGGVANSVSTATTSTFSTAAGYVAGNNLFAAVIRQDGSSFWNNTAKTAGGALASGKTGAVAIDLNSNPWQFWTTPDITGTSGQGGGPLWNGDVTSSPSLPGTGQATGVFPSGATAGTGFAFMITDQAVWPVWQGQVLDSATFNFSATPPASLVTAGYVNWNDTTGNFAYPGPFNPLKINVSNAPGWTATTAYVAGNRVNAGAGWSGSAYTTGSAVCLFGVVTAGTSGSSASAFNAACASGTPASVGGIPGGSWPGATTVTDGSVTWALLTKVDYATLTGTLNDSSVTWTISTQYPAGAYIRGTTGNLYQADLSSTCTSASSGAGPTGTSFTTTDNTCTWVYLGPLTYSSNANIWPHQLLYAGGGHYQMQYAYSPTITVWYGGSAKQAYDTQQAGEFAPIMMAFHRDLYQDVDLWCAGGYGLVLMSQANNCGAHFWFATFQTATGDSWADNFTASTPLRIDQTKGVTLTNTAAWGGGSLGYYSSGQEPVALSDSAVAVDGFQWKSTNGIAINCHAFYGPATQHCNNIQFTRDIIQSGASAPGTIFCDGGCAAISNIIIDGSTVTGNTALSLYYQGNIVANNVIVGTGASNSSCIDNHMYFSPFPPGNFYNNLCLGFSFPYAHDIGSPTWPSVPGANNATSSPASGYGGSFTNSQSNTMVSVQLPGVNTSSGCGAGQASPCSGLTAANQLVNSTIGGSFDARVKSTSADVYGAGANYSVANILLNGGTSASTVDVINQTWSPRWDVGAEKFQGTSPPTSLRLHWLGHP